MWPRAFILHCQVLGDRSYCTIIFPLFFIEIRCSFPNIPSTYLQNSWKLIFPCCFVLSQRFVGYKYPCTVSRSRFLVNPGFFSCDSAFGCENTQISEAVISIQHWYATICNIMTVWCFPVLFTFEHNLGWSKAINISLRGIEHQPDHVWFLEKIDLRTPRICWELPVETQWQKESAMMDPNVHKMCVYFGKFQNYVLPC